MKGRGGNRGQAVELNISGPRGRAPNFIKRPGLEEQETPSTQKKISYLGKEAQSTLRHWKQRNEGGGYIIYITGA